MPRQNGRHFPDYIFKNAFSWMKMYGFRLRFHLSLFLRFQLTIFQHWFNQEGSKQLSELMRVSLRTHLCATGLNVCRNTNKYIQHQHNLRHLIDIGTATSNGCAFSLDTHATFQSKTKYSCSVTLLRHRMRWHEVYSGVNRNTVNKSVFLFNFNK